VRPLFESDLLSSDLTQIYKECLFFISIGLSRYETPIIARLAAYQFIADALYPPFCVDALVIPPDVERSTILKLAKEGYEKWRAKSPAEARQEYVHCCLTLGRQFCHCEAVSQLGKIFASKRMLYLTPTDIFLNDVKFSLISIHSIDPEANNVTVVDFKNESGGLIQWRIQHERADLLLSLISYFQAINFDSERAKLNPPQEKFSKKVHSGCIDAAMNVPNVRLPDPAYVLPEDGMEKAPLEMEPQLQWQWVEEPTGERKRPTAEMLAFYLPKDDRVSSRFGLILLIIAFELFILSFFL
jgi:hypothetical protein